ncbi:hypothetical protein ABZP36_008335 [Zizania latifolia]
MVFGVELAASMQHLLRAGGRDASISFDSRLLNRIIPREANGGGAGIRIGSVWVCGFGAGCGEVSPPLPREAAVRFSPTIASGAGGGAADGPSSPPVAGLIQIELLGFLEDLGRVYGRLDKEF